MKPINFSKEPTFHYDSPQSMYDDNKQKKINGLIDYQSKIISDFMKQYGKNKDIALELPTGSGKTLVGLVIAEYIRRKYHKKVVYVCLNNQLVNQVVLEANEKYNIKAVPFTGSKENYSPTSILSYKQAEKIAVTNYSSIFNYSSYFSDDDIFYLFDDVHNASSYISNNWSVSIKKNDMLFNDLIDILKPIITENAYAHLTNDREASSDHFWIDMVPITCVDRKSRDIINLLDSLLEDSQSHIYFSWKNIRNNLSACNIFLNEDEILIRPQISPCTEIPSFAEASTRVYMSATLGKSGELEKTFGIEKINEITLSKTDKPNIGRHLFLLPDLLFKNENKDSELFKQLQGILKKGVALVNSTPEETKLAKSIQTSSPEVTIFSGHELEHKMANFRDSTNAIAILANRYDGVSFPDDFSHLELLKNLKIYENLQESFFSSRLKAAPIIEEKQITKITQAIGRCTRSANDYAIVVIEGKDVQNVLLNKQHLFEPELRAEICTGITISTSQDKLTELSEVGQLILNQQELDWQKIEHNILETRDNFNKENEDLTLYDFLKSISHLEVKFQYALWNDDTHAAIEISNTIVNKITGTKDKRLTGFLYYWKYLYFSIKLRQSSDNYSTSSVMNDFISFINNESHSISWFASLSHLLNKTASRNDISQTNDNRISLQINNIEEILNTVLANKTKTARMNYFSKQKEEILSYLQKGGGVQYEKAVQQLGLWIGLKSENTTLPSGPDPWWFIDGHTIIVSEIKILDSSTPISSKHIAEFNGHQDWLINSQEFPYIDKTMTFKNVLISNSSTLTGDAQKIILQNSLYLNSKDLFRFAQSALNTVTQIYDNYYSQGDMLWTLNTRDIISNSCLSAERIFNSLTKKLSELRA